MGLVACRAARPQVQVEPLLVDGFWGEVVDVGEDVAHELGDPEEASLREALHYIRTGRCTPESARAADYAKVVL